MHSILLVSVITLSLALSACGVRDEDPIGPAAGEALSTSPVQTAQSTNTSQGFASTSTGIGTVNVPTEIVGLWEIDVGYTHYYMNISNKGLRTIYRIDSDNNCYNPEETSQLRHLNDDDYTIEFDYATDAYEAVLSVQSEGAELRIQILYGNGWSADDYSLVEGLSFADLQICT